MQVENRRILDDCFFLDMHIPVYVEDWPEPPGPAHPGVFADAFPAVLNKLIGSDRILTLHVESSDPEYFDELTFIRDVLAPRHLEYVLLPSRLDSHYKGRIGSVLFQWPLDSLQHIVDNWFMSPQVTIEGYSSHHSCLGELTESFFQPYNAGMLRKLLRTLELGFKLWRDNNGIFILSDKFGDEALRMRLTSPDLQETIRAAMRDVTQRSRD